MLKDTMPTQVDADEARDSARADPDTSRTAAAAPAVPRLGEELPIFCERCGYSLHGMPHVRCEHCSVLHFACPECGHHQPINTLRPAAQKFFGRLRAVGLVISVLVKLNFFGWLLFAWFAMGVEWSYRYNYISQPTRAVTSQSTVVNVSTPPTWRFLPREVDLEELTAFTVFALAFGLFGRMLLLRWRRGVIVGAVLGALVVGCVLLGAWFRKTTWYDRSVRFPPLSNEFFLLALMTFGVVIVGAVAAWPIWIAIVRLFLPRRTSDALLEWQRSLSNRVSALGRA